MHIRVCAQSPQFKVCDSVIEQAFYRFEALGSIPSTLKKYTQQPLVVPGTLQCIKSITSALIEFPHTDSILEWVQLTM